MYRMIAGLSASLLAFAGTPALAQSAADQKEEVVCQLLDNCSDAAPAGATAPAGHGAPRTSATRGFSLARPKAEAATASPAAAAAPVANRPAKPAYAGKAKSPAAKAGTYDLRVTFASGSSELTAAAKSRATIFASALQDPRLAGKRVRIEGHTDSVGSADKNRALSEQRAHAVADFLIGAGVDRGRLDVAGFGSSQPLPGLPTTAAAQRRVVAVLIK